MVSKRKNYFLVLVQLLVIASACNNHTEPMPPMPAQTVVSKYASILAKCKNLEADTLAIYSVGNIPDAKNFAYKGEVLSDTEAALLTPLPANEENNLGGNIYACYKLQIDKDHTGIIARTPAMYDDSSIKFLMLDHAKDSITGFVELAEIWGDAGDMLEKQSWLYKNDKQQWNAFLWQTTSHDPSLDNPKDTAIDETNDYYLLNLSQPSMDTISKTAGHLLKTFQQFNRK